MMDLVNNFQNYYNSLITVINELPEDSVLKTDIANDLISNIKNIDIGKYKDNRHRQQGIGVAVGRRQTCHRKDNGTVLPAFLNKFRRVYIAQGYKKYTPGICPLLYSEIVKHWHSAHRQHIDKGGFPSVIRHYGKGAQGQGGYKAQIGKDLCRQHRIAAVATKKLKGKIVKGRMHICRQYGRHILVPVLNQRQGVCLIKPHVTAEEQTDGQ